ncbi:MAG: DUF1592 domain-containing protein, partial [Verrucomicrobiota bacterium]
GFQPADRHLWTMVHEQLAADEMPPEKRPRPAEAETKTVMDWIAREQGALGNGSTRRLNRRELSAALQDVTGLDLDYGYSIPGDSKVDGFDTGAEALQDAADSVAQILEVTRRAVNGIRFLEPPPAPAFVADFVGIKDSRKLLEPWTAAGIYARPKGIQRPDLGLLLEPRWLGDRGGRMIGVPPPPDGRGIIRVRVHLDLFRPFPEVPDPILWAKFGGRVFEHREMSGPTTLEYLIQIDDAVAGDRGVDLEFTPRVEIPYGVKGFANEDKTKPEDKIPGGPGLFRPAYDRKKIRDPEKQPRPFVVLKWISVEPDFMAPWPPAAWGADVGDLADNRESAGRLLALWMDRAYRRPVNEQEQAPFMSFYDRLRKDGLSFDEALRAVFQSVLLSGPFRYLDATAHENRTIADPALASRLSFMLIGGPADAALRTLAATGRLRDPNVLDAEVDRLLNDPRSEAFFHPFINQWLEMEQPITLVMDYFQKQDFRFGRYLKDSMRKETLAYIARLIRDNRPARELVESDWTMMNNSLAVHYRYDGIEGGELRKVKLRKNDKRGGGILAHAGIQSMLCWMGDNWVIYRGAWTARHIIDDPPQLPPLEVPELDPSSGENRGKTFRELMAQHRTDPNCSVCHTQLDPIGFAFQNFDISGRWRDVEHEKYHTEELDGKIAWRGQGKTRPVDANGTMPGGETFSSFDEFKAILLKHYQKAMVRGLMKNFTLYASGRKAGVEEMAEIRRIMEQHEAKGYPLKDLLKGVFRSNAFLEN